MTLKKTIASYRLPDGSWMPQKDIEMHPLEETQILAYWAIHDVQIKVPLKPTQEEEHEWLIEHGSDYVKQKRAEWQKIHDSIQPELQAAHDKHQAAHDEWNKHAEKCIANGLDPDTTPEGKI